MKRVRYISSFAKKIERSEIEKLARHARERNAREGITGVLVAGGELFFQLIEGPDERVDALVARLNDDPRHHHVLFLSTEQGDLTRICPDWAMLEVDLSTESSDRAAPVRTLLHMAYVQRRLADEALEALEAYTWRGFIDAEISALNSEAEPDDS